MHEPRGTLQIILEDTAWLSFSTSVLLTLSYNNTIHYIAGASCRQLSIHCHLQRHHYLHRPCIQARLSSTNHKYLQASHHAHLQVVVDIGLQASPTHAPPSRVAARTPELRRRVS
ncbi:hypothetical protein BU16DRAFT_487990 [Lophium mytilinum]|uniref:Uncharacterized protein n=1 Tax=Lophium mytilinum TaxID=390894 RepID=A0A6A6QQT2_9PEZI|nr:hypothetical protein BU16DRAFT_487990 [Lophium mytilinum]